MSDDHPDQVAEARAEAGRAVRDIGHALVGHHAPIELLDDVFGFVLHIQAQSAFTGELRMRYELTLVATGQVLARSAATFIAVDQFIPPSS